MPIKQGFLELVRSVVFDTLFVPENIVRGKSTLFVIPFGQYAGRTIKTLDHTSMLQCGMLDSPKKFLIRKLRIGFYDSAERFIPVSHRIWMGGFALETMGKPIIEGKLTDYASEGCWEDAKHLNNFVDQHQKRGGQELPKNDPEGRLFQDVIDGKFSYGPNGEKPYVLPNIIELLEQQQPFHMTIYMDEPGNVPVVFCASMEGILARAVV